MAHTGCITKSNSRFKYYSVHRSLVSRHLVAMPAMRVVGRSMLLVSGVPLRLRLQLKTGGTVLAGAGNGTYELHNEV